jgi:hypothetical protein
MRHAKAAFIPFHGLSFLSAAGVASLRFYKLFIFLSCFIFNAWFSFAQSDSVKVVPADSASAQRYDIPAEPPKLVAVGITRVSPADPYYYLTPEQKRRRKWIVGSGNVIGYGGTMAVLYSTWYSKYDQTGFHTFNDFPEWKQVDKAGHLYSAYIESRGSMELWRWAGLERKKRIWIGGMSGAVYQTVIEVLDGFSEGWGWSWGDFGANILGSGVLVAQELAWNDQRIKLKFSAHRKTYNDPELNHRSDVLFGAGTPERILKDYNGQTYWASTNIRSFFPQSKWPAWLSISVGYGAEGLFGGTENIAYDETGNVTFYRSDIKRYRQWYLAPDIDLTKIKTNKKALKLLFTFLSAFKFPSPALELSNGKLKMRALVF